MPILTSKTAASLNIESQQLQLLWDQYISRSSPTIYKFPTIPELYIISGHFHIFQNAEDLVTILLIQCSEQFQRTTQKFIDSKNLPNTQASDQGKRNHSGRGAHAAQNEE